jgi:hypothetical protein
LHQRLEMMFSECDPRRVRELTSNLLNDTAIHIEKKNRDMNKGMADVSMQTATL